MKIQQFTRKKDVPHWKKQNFLSKREVLYVKHKGFEKGVENGREGRIHSDYFWTQINCKTLTNSFFQTTSSHLQRQKNKVSVKAEVSSHHQKNLRASTVQWKLLRLKKWHRECKNGISDHLRFMYCLQLDEYKQDLSFASFQTGIYHLELTCLVILPGPQ